MSPYKGPEKGFKDADFPYVCQEKERITERMMEMKPGCSKQKARLGQPAVVKICNNHEDDRNDKATMAGRKLCNWDEKSVTRDGG